MSKYAECVVFASHKGGTGKTTSCLSVAGYLAKGGRTVLVIDLDPQASATSGLGIDAMTLSHSIYDAVLGQCNGFSGVSMTQVILETGVEGLHLAPAELDLSMAEVLLHHAKGRAGVLNRLLQEVRPLYDFILIDLPPSPGLLTINGLRASDQVVVPVDPSIFSLEALDSLKSSLRDIARLTGHTVGQITALLVPYERPSGFSRMIHRRNPSQDVEARLREMFHTVFLVPRSDEIYGAQRDGIPISHYAPRSEAGKAYARIAETIRINALRKSGFREFDEIEEGARWMR